MRGEHWILMGLTLLLALLLLLIALAARRGRGLYRFLWRAFWCFTGICLGSNLGGIGLNAFSFLFTLCLGVPGYAALTALALL